ncbi:MAG: hypothetical protein Q4A28_07615 [Brachymonas sp.]|nr:hypothetical protein [Brachymonas sp.]
MTLSFWLDLLTFLPLSALMVLVFLWPLCPSAMARQKQTIHETHRPLAEAELNRLYKECFHESLQLDGSRKIWEQENFTLRKDLVYELIVILQDREGEYLWFRYRNDAPALLKPTTAAIVQRLMQGPHASSTPLSNTLKLNETQTWNLSK